MHFKFAFHFEHHIGSKKAWAPQVSFASCSVPEFLLMRFCGLRGNECCVSVQCDLSSPKMELLSHKSQIHRQIVLPT